MEYLLIIALGICLYLLIKNNNLKKIIIGLNEENNFSKSIINRYRETADAKKKVSDRIKITCVKFDDIDISEMLIVDDQLDSIHKGLVVYITRNPIELTAVSGNDLVEIARIDLSKMSNEVYKVERLIVQEGYRRKKIATKIMLRVLEWAKLRGTEKLVLFPSATECIISQWNLIIFYMSFGFKCDGDNMKLELKEKTLS